MGNFIATEILFGIVWIIGALVLREFIISKDGMLRKIMIAYFAVEVFTYLGAAIYFLAIEEKWSDMSINTFRIVVITPKVFVKLWLLWYLKSGRKKLKSSI